VQRTEKRPRSEWVAVPVPDAGVSLQWVDAAKKRVHQNVRISLAGQRLWELSGGVLYCGGCDKRMVPDRSRSSSNRQYHFYYRCNTKHKRGKDACPMPKSFRADRLEPLVWEFVSGLLKSPDALREGLERMIEEEKTVMRGNPEREAKTWLSKLAEVDRKRSGFQDMAAEGLITFEELREKLDALEETREVAERELEAAGKRRDRVEQLERDKDALLEQYACLTPDVVDTASPEDRRRVYEMLRLRIIAQPDGRIEANGEYIGVPGIRTTETTSL